MKSIWRINEQKFVFDFDDLESMNRYEEACNEMKRKSKSAPKFTSRQDLIRFYCTAYFDFFDYLFGEGTADKIFNGAYNMGFCDEVYDQFLSWVKTSIQVNDRRRNHGKKYTNAKRYQQKEKRHKY